MKRIRLRQAGLLLTPVLVAGLAASSPSTAMAWIGRIAPPRQAGCRPEVTVPPQSHAAVLEPGSSALRLTAQVTLRGWAGAAAGGRPGDAVTASVTGLPSGVTADVVPDRPTPSSPSGTVIVTTVLTAGPSAEEGTYSLRLDVRCADASASGALPLRLIAAAPGGGLSVVPNETTLLAGDVTGFCLRPSTAGAARGTRPAAAPPAPFTIAGLPPEAEASFRPGHRTSPGCARLTVRTAPGTPAGDYRLTIMANTARHGPSGARALLHVRDQQALPFSVTGTLPDGLRPGRTLPLDVTVDNPNPTPIRLSKLSVMITDLDAGRATRCPVDPNLVVTPFTGDYSEFVVPARGRSSLAGLGFPPAAWPQITLLDTGTNRTGCLGAVPRFMFTGTADATAS